MTAHILVVKLFLLTAAEIDFSFFFGENEGSSFDLFDFRNWLRNNELFCCVALLHQMAAVIHCSDVDAFFVVSVASRSQKSRDGAGFFKRMQIRLF